jgi:RNA polymerase sigma-B factor
MVRPPRNLSDLTLLIERSRQPLQVAIGREPAPADFASHLGQRREVVAEALQAAGARTACSLEAEHHGNGEAETIGERFGGDDHGYEHAEARATFESLLCVLDQRAREILRLRFADDLPQSQIAARVGCSQVSISRIIRSSIEKLSAYALAPAG